MGELHVKELHPDYFQVTEGPDWHGRWWTAKRLVHLAGGWYIVNSRGTVIKQTGTQGRRIIAAIRKVAPHVLTP